MTSRTDRLLCCAVAYTNAEISETPIPKVTSSTTVEEHIENMMNVLWFEAKQTLTQPMTDIPSDPYLHVVDMDTMEPGIVSSKAKLDVHRRKVPVPKVTYNHRKPMKLYDIFEDSQPELSVNEAFKKAAKEIEKDQKKAERKASRELKTEKESIEKISKREEAKQKRQNETPEERDARLVEMREKRAKRKEEKDAKQVAEENESTDNIKVEKKLETTPESLENTETVKNISLNVQELLESEVAEPTLHSVLPPRIKARNRKTKFYSSPVPYDRHLVALEASWPSEHIKGALLEGIHDSRVKLIQGPPGTGKTTTLINLVNSFPNSRILICSCTNVGTANLYTRALKMGLSCSLMMPQSRIPPGTPITSQDPNNRIICSTISGRAGPILDAEVFEVVLVDEAAQCMEPWLWGLIRPEVEHIVMVGDTAQLPALVSEIGQSLGHNRSLMQRLMESQYPYEMLQVQRRMHPQIVEFPNSYFYDGKLQTEYETSDIAIQDPYLLYSVKSICHEIGTSFQNEIEAEFCVQKAREMMDKTSDVVILCPYQAQARQLLSLGSNIPVHTIDSFQGREADVIILSIVRTKECGFWADKRRLCVALTRAKHALYIVGNCEEWTGPLHDLFDDATRRGVVR